MHFLTSEDYFPNNYQNVVLYFYTTWMPFHKKMVLMLDKLEDKYDKLTFIAIDVDYFKKFKNRFDIKNVPTILLFKRGNEEKRIIGAVMQKALKSAFVDIYKHSNL